MGIVLGTALLSGVASSAQLAPGKAPKTENVLTKGFTFEERVDASLLLRKLSMVEKMYFRYGCAQIAGTKLKDEKALLQKAFGKLRPDQKKVMDDRLAALSKGDRSLFIRMLRNTAAGPKMLKG